MFKKSQYRLAKDYRVGIFLFLILIVGIETATILLPKYWKSEVEISMAPNEVKELQFQEEKGKKYKPDFSQLKLFNPNDYSDDDWQKLGLSERQIQTLNNYKKAIGGFKSKAQFKKCYAISDEFYAEIEPYLILPESGGKSYHSKSYNNYSSKTFTPKKIVYHHFNPNDYTMQDWMKIGFTEKQAQTILNYKNKFLKGKFTKVEELEKCYAVSTEKYLEMKPYVILPEAKNSSDLQPKFEEKETKIEPIQELKPFNVNTLDAEGWEQLGFTPKQVKTIMNYKRYCGGEFTSLEQFKKCYSVSNEMFEKLKPFIRFSD